MKSLPARCTEDASRLPDASVRVADGTTSTVGKRLARVPRTSARACANCASAARSVWLDTSICCSSALRSASPNSCHQLPRSWSSAGCAVFQSAFSRNAGAISTVGATYLLLGAQADSTTSARITIAGLKPGATNHAGLKPCATDHAGLKPCATADQRCPIDIESCLTDDEPCILGGRASALPSPGSFGFRRR